MENKEIKNRILKEIREWLRAIVVTLVIGLLITNFVRPTIVVGESMSNTLMPYDYLVVYRKAYINSLPEYNDIVLAQSKIPLGEDEKVTNIFTKLLNFNNKNINNKIVIKRVIGLPGDIIEIRDGYVYRNSEKLIEDYTRDGITLGEGYYEIPDGHLFLLGDNRQGSMDSRDSMIGMIPKEDILGKIIIRLFPFNKITTNL